MNGCFLQLKSKAEKQIVNEIKAKVDSLPTRADLETFKSLTFGDMQHVADANLELRAQLRRN